MKTIVISASPNKVGLTNTCVETCVKALEKQNHEVETICLNNFNIKKCEACGPRGWGICLEEHKCRIKDDDFSLLQEKINSFEAIILISPVYFWEMSESAKTFLDRFRRCEAFNGKSSLIGRPIICIAAAGGSGNGTKECLASMSILAHFLKLKVIDYIDVTKANVEDKKGQMIKSVMKLVDLVELKDEEE